MAPPPAGGGSALQKPLLSLADAAPLGLPYEDGFVRLTPSALTLKRYYFPTFHGKTIKLKDIQEVGRSIGSLLLERLVCDIDWISISIAIDRWVAIPSTPCGFVLVEQNASGDSDPCGASPLPPTTITTYRPASSRCHPSGKGVQSTGAWRRTAAGKSSPPAYAYYSTRVAPQNPQTLRHHPSHPPNTLHSWWPSDMLRHRRTSFIELDLGDVWPLPVFTTDKDTATLHALLVQVSLAMEFVERG